MTDNQAVPAGAIMESYQRLTEHPKIKKVSTSQSKIASLVNSTGFKAMQEIIDAWIESLRDLPIDPKKDDVETIGFRYLASKVTIEYLTDLRNMPERYKKLLETKEDE